MTSTRNDAASKSLASILLSKRTLPANDASQMNDKLLVPPALNGTGSYSNDRLSYRQDPFAINRPMETSSTHPLEQSHLSHKTKQIEVESLGKKMDEINRKQETKTNETLDIWKGFDALNYGFLPGSETTNNPLVSLQPAIRSQQTQDSRSNQSHVQDPQTPSVHIEPITTLKSSQSNSGLAEKDKDLIATNTSTFTQSFASANNGHIFKIFPDKKRQVPKPQNAYRTIQRSMERYRFYVW